MCVKTLNAELLITVKSPHTSSFSTKTMCFRIYFTWKRESIQAIYLCAASEWHSNTARFNQSTFGWFNKAIQGFCVVLKNGVVAYGSNVQNGVEWWNRWNKAVFLPLYSAGSDLTVTAQLLVWDQELGTSGVTISFSALFQMFILSLESCVDPSEIPDCGVNNSATTSLLSQ